jgi:Family of unknown function (DUF6191)
VPSINALLPLPVECINRPVRWPIVGFVFFMTIPGLAAVLVVLAALDRFGVWLHGRSGLPWYRDGHRPAPAAGFDELQAVFYSSNRHQIERRRAELMLRDDEHDGARPRARVDLDAGRAVITPTTVRRQPVIR